MSKQLAPRRPRKPKKKKVKSAGTTIAQCLTLAILNRKAGSFRMVGFPDEYRCLLRYSMNESVSGVAGAIVTQAFRANALYDPDLTNAGHQPTYFDQLSAVYGKYLVVGCAIKVELLNSSSTVPLNAVLTASDKQLSSLASIDALCECPYSKYVTIASIAAGTRTLEFPILKTEKIMGQKGIEQDNTLYALVSAAPNDPWYYELNVQSMVASTTDYGYIRCDLLFECIFKELYSPGES